MNAARSPRLPRMSIVERAEKYLDLYPTPLCGTGQCRKAAFRAASILVQGFALGVAEALPLLCRWAARNPTHGWTEVELRKELESACNESGFKSRGALLPRGCLLKDSGMVPSRQERAGRGIPTETEHRAQLKFDAERLRSLAGDWLGKIDLAWLANRSAVDPATVSADAFLRALYRPERGEKVIVMAKYDDGALWPDEPLPEGGRDGVKLLANPVDGEWRPNMRAARDKWVDGQPPMSRRIWECVVNFRFLVLESDVAKPQEWLAFLAQAPLRIAAIYTSGGKSVHTLVRVDCATRAAFEAEKARLAPFLSVCVTAGADRGPLSLLAPTRLPGTWREGKVKPPAGPGEKWSFFPFKDGPHRQKLLYLRPEPAVRPLVELPPVRDVEASWCRQAQLVVDGYDPERPLAEIRAALSYYAPVSAACRAALAELPEDEISA